MPPIIGLSPEMAATPADRPTGGPAGPPYCPVRPHPVALSSPACVCSVSASGRAMATLFGARAASRDDLDAREARSASTSRSAARRRSRAARGTRGRHGGVLAAACSRARSECGTLVLRVLRGGTKRARSHAKSHYGASIYMDLRALRDREPELTRTCHAASRPQPSREAQKTGLTPPARASRGRHHLNMGRGRAVSPRERGVFRRQSRRRTMRSRPSRACAKRAKTHVAQGAIRLRIGRSAVLTTAEAHETEAWDSQDRYPKRAGRARFERREAPPSAPAVAVKVPISASRRSLTE